MTLQLRLGFWPVKSGQCSNVLPIVSVVGPNYQSQLLPTSRSMFLVRAALEADELRPVRLALGLPMPTEALAIEAAGTKPLL